MDLQNRLLAPGLKPISCVEMHTTGEPTRVIVDGYPTLTGTLLEQRAQAKAQYDHIRRRLILEPRGHYDMYGAILRPETELTSIGEAHIGILFITNEGYSTMCGHATIALGRLLLDTHDVNVFPQRDEVQFDVKTKIATLNLHAPCGLLRVSVPVNEDGSASDPTRPVSFVSVPSFATACDVAISIPNEFKWTEVKSSRRDITVDFAYGGAFYCLISAEDLGFPQGLRGQDLDRLNQATAALKAYIISNSAYASYFAHPDHDDLSFLYGVIVTDKSKSKDGPDSKSEVGLCFFANQEIDRSPTGSGVAARAALAFRKGRRKLNEEWTYHSLVSRDKKGPGFIGRVVEELSNENQPLKYRQCRVQVEGQAFYTGFSTFTVEENDPLGEDGFVFKEL